MFIFDIISELLHSCQTPTEEGFIPLLAWLHDWNVQKKKILSTECGTGLFRNVVSVTSMCKKVTVFNYFRDVSVMQLPTQSPNIHKKHFNAFAHVVWIEGKITPDLEVVVLQRVDSKSYEMLLCVPSYHQAYLFQLGFVFLLKNVIFHFILFRTK